MLKLILKRYKVNWIYLVQFNIQLWALVNTVVGSSDQKEDNVFLDCLGEVYLLKKDSAPRGYLLG